MSAIHVLLVDDQAIVRAGIRQLLLGMAGIKVVGEARDGEEALTQGQSLNPDIIMMDLEMPGMDGLEATEKLTQALPSARVVVLSSHVAGQHVVRAMRAGAKGYLLKDSEVSELELAIHAVARGETYISPGIGKRMQHLVRSAGKGQAATGETTLLRQEFAGTANVGGVAGS